LSETSAVTCRPSAEAGHCLHKLIVGDVREDSYSDNGLSTEEAMIASAVDVKPHEIPALVIDALRKRPSGRREIIELVKLLPALLRRKPWAPVASRYVPTICPRALMPSAAVPWVAEGSSSVLNERPLRRKP
jgi:hypothetical protein